MTDERIREVENRVREIMAQSLGRTIEDLTPEATFDKDLGADSLMLLELMRDLEEEFGIEIPDEDQEKVMNVGQAVA
ncbi:MAG: acyl carrier protein, partial [Candidatus Sumerlaeia bacterium]|nr:acyl carrier protein [Candidatus Sumerlaeia bacterium]